MNISSFTGTTPGAVPHILPSQSKQNEEESLTKPIPKMKAVISLLDEKKAKEEKKKPEVKREDLVMQLTPIPLEERLNQIISVEEVKDILSLVTRIPRKEKKEHQVDFKR